MSTSEGAGAALARAIREGLPPGMELDERESALLAMAAAQADVVAALEADVAERGIMVPGARGGMVVNPAVIEARQGRTALSRLLAGIDLPDSESFVALRASRAARARWNGQEAP